MAPELVREFGRAFHEEVNRAAAEREQQFKADGVHLAAIERRSLGPSQPSRKEITAAPR